MRMSCLVVVVVIGTVKTTTIKAKNTNKTNKSRHIIDRLTLY